MDGKYWYSASEACALKGIRWNTLRKRDANGRTREHLLPNFGRATEVLSTGKYRRMFTRDQVEEWLPKTQADIERELEEISDYAGVS